MITIPLQPFYIWCLVFLRTLAIFIFFPLFGENFAPVRVRILMAAFIALALCPVVPVTAAMFPGTLPGFVRVVLAESLLGFAIGMIGRILFAIIQFSGQLMGEQMGFGMVNAIDPTGSHQVSIVAEMLYVLAILLFLAAGLHHTLLAVLARSFHVLPPGGATLTPGLAKYMTGLGTILFDFSLRLAMPIIVIVFASNVALGMIARGVPQINVFMESFPLRILAGVAVLLLSLGFMVALWDHLFGEMEGMMTTIVKLMKG